MPWAKHACMCSFPLPTFVPGIELQGAGRQKPRFSLSCARPKRCIPRPTASCACISRNIRHGLHVMKLPLPRFQGGFDIVGIQLSNPVMIKRRRETNAVLDKVKDWNITFFCRVTIFISTALHTAAESNLKDPHCHLLRKPPPQDLQHANNTKHLFILH